MQINILTEQEAATFQELLAASKNIIICCHKSPDGDALGATLAWAEFLRLEGKEPMMVVPDAFPDFLRWLPNVEKIVRYDKHQEMVDKKLQEADLIFGLDFNVTDRVEDIKYNKL